ncbi:hypothetical protein P3521_23460 [Vibrio parahaemolyticus]|uniref:hypothetical protein n=1 Tax=Vibrio TaxID=662 RepID=UPI0004D3FDE5|nr:MULTISPECIES: hypothetical protein [Vibrio]EGQ7896047.1 hypothetical protein [Vibrio parahaemolyticus]EGQ8481344.1 hypothetical protein [Vibrio parahaemolyticus]EGR1284118.1 hypothetical protein [Vibrio parahaemolyticus]EGR1793159.1 hypothetical protein [Vibrio parahaemolyticus]EGR1938064.1 hypothetical protein [Vibrio parahaemolyticus]
MSSNCSEFNFLIDRKSIYTSNDIPSLVAYNKCLINEINNLTTKTDELEGSLKSNSSDIKSLNDSISNQEKLFETKIVMLSSSFDSKIENVATVQEQSVDNFTSMFETIQNSYANHLTGLSIILACAGIFFFLGAKAYKKREINDLKDETLTHVRATLTKEGLVRNLVETSLTDSKVTELLDTRLNTIADGLEQQIINRIKDKELYNQRTDSPDCSDNGNLSDIIQ